MTAAAPPVALTIAGSDSGGGAGIQADLKTFAGHTVFGVCAITCVTAQNTMGVARVDAIPAEGVRAQLDAVRDDFSIAAGKLGMLLNAEIMLVVADALDQVPLPQLVLDPVMVARSGDRLIDVSAVDVLRDRLLPHAAIVTPNIAEAEILAGMRITDVASMQEAANRLVGAGARAVLITGGSLRGEDQAKDVLVVNGRLQVLRTECVDTPNTHGTGCTLSAAIAANLARGVDLAAAAEKAKAYVTQALRAGISLGRGSGPLLHGPC